MPQSVRSAESRLGRRPRRLVLLQDVPEHTGPRARPRMPGEVRRAARVPCRAPPGGRPEGPWSDGPGPSPVGSRYTPGMGHCGWRRQGAPGGGRQLGWGAGGEDVGGRGCAGSDEAGGSSGPRGGVAGGRVYHHRVHEGSTPSQRHVAHLLLPGLLAFERSEARRGVRGALARPPDHTRRGLPTLASGPVARGTGGGKTGRKKWLQPRTPRS